MIKTITDKKRLVPHALLQLFSYFKLYLATFFAVFMQIVFTLFEHLIFPKTSINSCYSAV